MATPRVPVSLVSIRTSDGVTLAGLMAEPRRRRRVTALIWVHGLGSAFANGQPLIRALSRRLTAAGIAYVKLDTRGHHVVARAGRRVGRGAVRRLRGGAWGGRGRGGRARGGGVR